MGRHGNALRSMDEKDHGPVGEAMGEVIIGLDIGE
jgi:hypothetical protein